MCDRASYRQCESNLVLALTLLHRCAVLQRVAAVLRNGVVNEAS